MARPFDGLWIRLCVEWGEVRRRPGCELAVSLFVLLVDLMDELSVVLWVVGWVGAVESLMAVFCRSFERMSLAI